MGRVIEIIRAIIKDFINEITPYDVKMRRELLRIDKQMRQYRGRTDLSKEEQAIYDCLKMEEEGIQHLRLVHALH